MGTPIPGTIIAAKVTTGNTDNTFAIADLNEAQGGMHLVSTVAERDAIPAARRQNGMTVWVSNTTSLWRLVGGITNSDWVLDTTYSIGTLAQDLYQEQTYRVVNDGTISVDVSQALTIAQLALSFTGTDAYELAQEQNYRVVNDGTLNTNVSNLTSYLDQEQNYRVVNDGTLNTNVSNLTSYLDQEQAYRVINDGTLNTNVAQTLTIAQLALSFTGTDAYELAQEQAYRVINDGTLNTNVSNLTSYLDQEQAYRVINDGTLNTNVSNLTSYLAQEQAYRVINDGTNTNATNAALSIATTALYYTGTTGTGFVLIAGDTMTGTLSAPNVAYGHVTTLYAGTITIDFTGSAFQTVSLTGDTLFLGKNYHGSAGYVPTATVRVISDSTTRNLTFDSNYVFINAKPVTILANKTGILSLTCFGVNASDVVACYGVQQ